MRKAALAISVVAVFPMPMLALAQSVPPWNPGALPTGEVWNKFFAGKQDVVPTTSLSSFGQCKGVNDNQIIKDAFSYASTHGKKLYLDQFGCKVLPDPDHPVITITGTNWEVYGDGRASSIEIGSDGEMFRVDVSSTGAFYNRFHDMRIFSRLGAGNHPNTYAIRYYCNSSNDPFGADPGTCQPTSYQTFQSIYATGLQSVFKFDRTSWFPFPLNSTIYQEQKYSAMSFYDIQTDNAFSDLVNYVIKFDSGSGTTLVVSGGQFNCKVECISIGDRQSAVGDILISNIHILAANAVGIRIYGSQNLDAYGENVEISGIQTDSPETNTFVCENLRRVKYFGTNSTSQSGPSITNCSFAMRTDRFSATSDTSTPLQGFGTGSSHGMFRITRVNQSADLRLYDAVEAHIFCHGIITNLGVVTLSGDYHLYFQGISPSGSLAGWTQLHPDEPGGYIKNEGLPGEDRAADHIAFAWSRNGGDQLIGSVVMTNTPDGSQVKCDVHLIGDAAVFTLYSGF